MQELVCLQEMSDTLTLSIKPSGPFCGCSVYDGLMQELVCLQEMSDTLTLSIKPSGPFCGWSVYGGLVQLVCLQKMIDYSP